MTNTHIGSFVHLTKLKYAEKALPLLEKIASMVKPIMNKHGWTLPVLAEFLPDNPSLLGMNINGGQKIFIRLRPHHAQDTFIDFDDLIGTMLHELSHNVHGPHDAAFYAFLKVLTEEFDALQASGYAGEGFHSTGHRFGTSHNLPPHLAKLKALAAAEDRAKKARLMGPGGKLGGAGTMGKSMRELALEAAQRRLKDDKTCGSGSDFDKTAEILRVEREGTVVPNTSSPLGSSLPSHQSPPTSSVVSGVSVPSKSNDITPGLDQGSVDVEPENSIKERRNDKEVILIDDSDEDQDSSVSTEPTVPSDPTRPIPKTPSDDRQPRSTPSESRADPGFQTGGPSRRPEGVQDRPEQQTQWPCPTCTFLNAQILPSCEMCETPRPGPFHQAQVPSQTQARPDSSGVLGSGWSCRVCGRGPIGLEWWCCTNPGCSGVRGWS